MLDGGSGWVLTKIHGFGIVLVDSSLEIPSQGVTVRIRTPRSGLR